MSWLPAVLHLLQGDPEHSGRAKGVAEGSIEALPHRLHSLAASVRLHTEMPRTRSRYQGWGASSDNNSRQQEQNKMKIRAGPLPSRKRRFLSCASKESLNEWSDCHVDGLYSRQMRHAGLVDGSRWLRFSSNMQIPTQTILLQRTSCSC